MIFQVQELGLTLYNDAWDLQKKIVSQIDSGELDNQLLLLEHPHTITLGRGSDSANIISSRDELKRQGIDVVEIDRGGDVTYHGPGQLVGYPLFYLTKGPHEYLRMMEQALILALKHWDIEATTKEQYTGVWVEDQKIAAIGVKFNLARKRKGCITSHGFALNVNTDLAYFDLIVPCGIRKYGVTSLEQLLGRKVDIEEVKVRVVEAFQSRCVL